MEIELRTEAQRDILHSHIYQINNILKKRQDFALIEVFDELKSNYEDFITLVEKLNDSEQNISRIIHQKTRHQVLTRQKWKCNNCGVGVHFSIKHGENVAEIDHIHPYSERHNYFKGSKNINELSNLQALCKNCNRVKYNRKD